MSDLPSTLTQSLAPGLLLQIDAVCQRFEDAWQAASGGGPSPRVEEYLAGSDGALRRELLRQLVLLEVEYRRRRGEQPSADEYHARFPELDCVWLEEVPSTSALVAGRYRLVAGIGKGGMGTVLRAHDATLGRDVAYKVLREEHRGRPERVCRFVDEARIVGRLQHPGIVPVYDMGRAADARPFFTMKVVEGRELHDLLAERASPADGLARFLGVFEQICQAVGYAHSQGILHRDLKPRNVMVGAFGEVQVVDWGCAKVLDRQLPDTTPGAAAVTSADLAETPVGATEDGRGVTRMVGTPSFMPPEQAREESQGADERADVFGLGAILCVILTGQPPFVGGTSEEVVAKAAAGDVADAFARLDRCGADAELVALCKECLAPGAEGRPANGGEVAARVAAYQAAVRERLQQAELERSAAEARATEAKATAAAERKARRRTQAMAFAVLLVVAVGSAGALLVQRERQAKEEVESRRRSEALDGMKSEMTEARKLRAQALENPLDDLGRLREAKDHALRSVRLAGASEAASGMRAEAQSLMSELTAQEEAARKDHDLLRRLTDMRHTGALTYSEAHMATYVKIAMPGVPGLGRPMTADEQFESAFLRWRVRVYATPVAEAAAQFAERPPAIRTELIAALDDIAIEQRQHGRDPARVQWVSDFAAALDRDADPRRRELRALLTSGDLERERALGALSVAMRPVPIPFDAVPRPARERLRQLAKVDTAAYPVTGLLSLSRALELAGDVDSAERLLRWAVELRKKAEVDLLYALGQLLERRGQWAQAAGFYRVVRSLSSGPVRPWAVEHRLALALVKSGQIEEGVEYGVYQEPYCAYELGLAVYDQGRNEEAEPLFRASLSPLFTNLISFDDPEKTDFPEARFYLGATLDRQGCYAEADVEYRRAIQSHFRMYGTNGERGTIPRQGNILGAMGRFKESETEFRKDLRLKPDGPTAHIDLGDRLYFQGRYKEAEAEYKEAIRLKPDFPEAYIILGISLRSQGDFDHALTYLRRGDELARKIPGWPYPTADLIWGCERLRDLDRKLPSVLRSETEPVSAAERIEFAHLCQNYKRLLAAATRLYAGAIAIDPKLAADLKKGLRCKAASAAIQAAAGQGKDARGLSDKGVVMFRRWALAWLRAELAEYDRLTGPGDDLRTLGTVIVRLEAWRRWSSDLASVRDKEALDKLPGNESRAWRDLWDDVSALLTRIHADESALVNRNHAKSP
jgi:serine/threonine-protein kinase